MSQNLGSAEARLIEAEVAAETAIFQRDVAWARLAESRLQRTGRIERPGESRPDSFPVSGPEPERHDVSEARADSISSQDPAAGRESGALRIALLSTPRTGNTWIRTILAECYGLEQIAVHSPNGVPWRALPPRVIVQLHWHRLPAFRRALREFGFRVVTIARNPLDVLVSVLQFCQWDRTMEFWLSGEGGGESGLVGATPQHLSFRCWALSARARALLSVTPEWWAETETIRIRYEDAVADPRRALTDVGRLLEVEPSTDPGDVGARVTLDDMRRRFTANPGHFWQGRSGAGIEVLDSVTAEAIVATHAPVFQALEYPCHLAERSVDQAREAWRLHEARSRRGSA